MRRYVIYFTNDDITLLHRSLVQFILNKTLCRTSTELNKGILDCSGLPRRSVSVSSSDESSKRITVKEEEERYRSSIRLNKNKQTSIG